MAGLALLSSMLATGCAGPAGVHAAGAGESTALALQARYDDTRANCGAASRPAFLCSGLLVRSHPRDGEPWLVGPPEQALNAMVAGYIRADSQASRLPEGAFSAIVYYPVLGRPSGLLEYEVLCASPTPSDPLQRELQGCGRHPVGGDASVRCAERKPPILGAEEWVVEYRNITPPEQRPYRVCNFDVRDSASQTARAFEAYIRASSVLHDAGEPFPSLSGVVMMSLMPADEKAKLPIEAFIYDATFAAAPGNAGEMQRALHEATGIWKPVIRVRMPPAFSDRATFTYRDEDQAIREP